MSRCSPGVGVHDRYTRRNRFHRRFASATVRRNVRADPAYPAARATGSSLLAVILPSVFFTLPKIKPVSGSARPTGFRAGGLSFATPSPAPEDPKTNVPLRGGDFQLAINGYIAMARDMRLLHAAVAILSRSCWPRWQFVVAAQSQAPA
jgi:hypothetical protein